IPQRPLPARPQPEARSRSGGGTEGVMRLIDLLTLGGIALLAGLLDWLVVTRLAAYFTDFDYRYWPLTRGRQIGFAALIVAAVYMWAMAGTNGPLWLLIPFGVLIAVWLATALNNLNSQRRAGHQTPPRYSEDGY